jgi:SAM-dependent methyltransferase
MSGPVDYRAEFYESYGRTGGHRGAPTEGERRAAARQFRARWRRWLPAESATPILDVGCGPGLFVAYLRAQGYTDVVGIDWSPGEVARAAEAGIAGVQCAEALEFLRTRPGAYGLVTLLNVFEHLRKDEVVPLLRALHGALRPGGRVLAVTPNGLSPFAGATRYWDFSHELSFTPAAWRQLAAVAGFAAPVFEEYGPVAHSAAGVVRCALWRALALGIQAFAWIEVGGPRDPSRVYTADMKIVLTR